MRLLTLGAAAAVLLLVALPAAATAPGRDGRILYADPKGDLFLVDPESGDAALVAEKTIGYAGVSADGRTVAFARRGAQPAPGDSVRVANIDGTGERIVIDGFTVVTDVAISPDGGTIAFAGVDINSSRPNSGGLYAVGSDGSNLRVLAATLNAGQPEFSPDGRWVAFHVFRGESCNEGSDADLLIARVDGSASRVVSGDRNDGETAPSFSPDGRRILYRRTETNCRADTHPESLHTVTPSGRRDREVTRPSTAYVDFPVYAPSGRRIAYFREGDIVTASATGERRARIPGASKRSDEYPLAWASPPR